MHLRLTRSSLSDLDAYDFVLIEFSTAKCIWFMQDGVRWNKRDCEARTNFSIGNAMIYWWPHRQRRHITFGTVKATSQLRRYKLKFQIIKSHWQKFDILSSVVFDGIYRIWILRWNNILSSIARTAPKCLNASYMCFSWCYRHHNKFIYLRQLQAILFLFLAFYVLAWSEFAHYKFRIMKENGLIN